jgi:hypothetical protein
MTENVPRASLPTATATANAGQRWATWRLCMYRAYRPFGLDEFVLILQEIEIYGCTCIMTFASHLSSFVVLLRATKP